MTDNPVGRLLEIGTVLERSGAKELADWLLAGVRAHISAGESLDKTLGLAGDLGRSPRYQYLLAQRNRHLAQALRLAGGDLQCLEREVVAFESRVCPVWQLRDAPPADWPALKVTLWNAYRVGIPVPRTAKGLRLALGNGTLSVAFPGPRAG